MRKLYILAVMAALAAGGAGVSAETVSPDEARRVADEFLGVRTQPSRIVRHGAKGAAATERQPYYVFNSQTADGGFVIVSGNTGARKILGYSRTGRFDTDSIPPQVADLLDQYSQCLSTLLADAPAHSSWKEQEASPDEVVLTTAKWNQDAPFNKMCPELKNSNQIFHNCVAGCLPIATSIIMRYHQWPLNGVGQMSYQWHGETLSRDFSQSTYNWNLMHDSYDDLELSSEEEYEVAHLVSDVGIAMKASYSLYATGADESDARSALVQNFGYHDKIYGLQIDWVPVSFFYNTAKHEIDHKRPVICTSSSTPLGRGGHAFVGDGYNSDGYLHYNFGWGGMCDGFYSLDPTEGFSGFGISMYYGIQPANQPSPELYRMPSVTSKEFVAYGNDYIYCQLSIHKGLVRTGAVLKVGFVCENTENGSKNFICAIEAPGMLDGKDSFWWGFAYGFKDDLADGHYLLYPAFQIDDNSWEECIYLEYNPNKIEMTVRNGERELVNLPPDINPLKFGAVEIDGICYTLDKDNHTAELTASNERYSGYSGDVTVPEEVMYEDERYVVTSVGNRAFKNCIKLGTVRLPETVEIIKEYAFYPVNMDSINLGALTRLRSIEGSAFYNRNKTASMVLPPNLESVGFYAYYGLECPILEIPESVNYLESWAFPNNRVDAFIFKRKAVSNLQVGKNALIQYSEGEQTLRHVTAFVPAGTKEDYLTYEDIQRCEVVEYTGEVVLPSDVSFMAEGKTYSDGENVGMAANGTIRLQPVFYPGNTTMTNVKWEYPEEYFSMDAEGNLKYLGNAEQVSAKRGVDGIGEVLTRSSATTALGPIVARTLDGSRLTRQFYVDIYPDTESVSLDVADKTLSNGEKFRLTATVTPEDAAGTIHWTSSNSTVATVSQEGEVMAMAPGTAVITATAADGSGVSASCEVTVSGGTVGVPMTGVDLNEPIEVYDAAGTCVYKGNADNLPALGKGFYIMTVRDRRIKVMR